ncbi:MAG: DUF1616 domain-containing protein [Dehalococcoidia bacterium]
MYFLLSVLSPFRDLFDFLVPYLDDVPALRAIIGFGLIFLLPGFAWSRVFFSREQVNILERIVLSFGLSVALVTLSMFALNLLFDVRISGFNAVMVVAVISLAALGFYLLRRYVNIGEVFRNR